MKFNKYLLGFQAMLNNSSHLLTESGRKLDLIMADSANFDQISGSSEYGSYCPEGIPLEQAICLLLAGFSIAFGILYTAVTLTTMGRKKRSTKNHSNQGVEDQTADLLWLGKQNRFLKIPTNLIVCME